MSKDQVSTEVANQAINEALAAQPIAPAADVSAPAGAQFLAKPPAFFYIRSRWSNTLGAVRELSLSAESHPDWMINPIYSAAQLDAYVLADRAARAAAPARPYFPLTPEQVQQIATKVAGCQTNPHERPFWEFGTITLQQFATDLTDYTTRVYSNNSTAGAAIPAQAAPVSGPTIDTLTGLLGQIPDLGLSSYGPCEIERTIDWLNELRKAWSNRPRSANLIAQGDYSDADRTTLAFMGIGTPDSAAPVSGQIASRFDGVEMTAYEQSGIDSRPRSEDSRAKEQYSATVWRTQAEGLETENKSLRDHLALRDQHKAADLWFWQGDEDDKLESMSNGMAVVIRADQLRALASTTPPKADNE